MIKRVIMFFRIQDVPGLNLNPENAKFCMGFLLIFLGRSVCRNAASNAAELIRSTSVQFINQLTFYQQRYTLRAELLKATLNCIIIEQ
jgi:hypothetical protein